jgi:hypothetical protein
MMSMSAIVSPLTAHDAAEVRQQRREVGVEARRGGAVDHAVVPAQAQRQDQARLEGLAVPHAARWCCLHTPMMATSGALMIGA